MSVSMDDVRKVLDPDEPDYAAAARLGEEALRISNGSGGDDPMLASKATYAASLIEGGSDVVEAAPVGGRRYESRRRPSATSRAAGPVGCRGSSPTTTTRASAKSLGPSWLTCRGPCRPWVEGTASVPHWPTRSKMRPSGQRMKRTE